MIPHNAAKTAVRSLGAASAAGAVVIVAAALGVISPDPVSAGPAAGKNGVQVVETLDLLPAPRRTPPAAEETTPTWLRHAAPVPANLDGPLIAIVIDDAGLNLAETQRAVRLPGPVTLAYMAYAERLPEQVAAARKAGHEILLHVPMETIDDDTDTGPNALLTGLPLEEFNRRLQWNLDRLEGYVGVNNHMGSRFTADRAGMRGLMRELRRRGLMFLDSRTTPDSVGSAVAEQMGIPNLKRDVFLDNEETRESVARELARAESIAREKGYAIAIGHPHEWTLDAIESWLPQAAKRGVVIVPVTTILRGRRFARN